MDFHRSSSPFTGLGGWQGFGDSQGAPNGPKHGDDNNSGGGNGNGRGDGNGWAGGHGSSATDDGQGDVWPSNQDDWGRVPSAIATQGDVRFTAFQPHYAYTVSSKLVAAIPSSGSVSAAALTALGAALKANLNSGSDWGPGANASDLTWSFMTPAALSSLPVGQSVLVEYLILVADNHGGVTSQPVTLLLNSGSTQPVIVSGDASAQIAEISGAGPSTLDAASGTVALAGGEGSNLTALSSKLAFVNWSGGTAIPAASLAALDSALSASLVLTGDGDGDTANPNSDDIRATSASWSFAAADKVFNFLSAGQTLTLAYEVAGKNACGQTVTQLVTITIDGTNHGPVLAADPASHATTDLVGGAGSATPDTLLANLNFTSSSLTDTHTVTIGAPTATWSGGAAIPAATLSALTSALGETLTDSVGTGTGSVSLSFAMADGLFHFLGQGETLTVVYNVTLADSHGNTSTQPVTFTITGVNDAPVVAVDTGVHAFTDVAGGTGSTTPDNLAANLIFTDVNLDDTHTVTIAAPTASWSGGGAIPAATLTALNSAVTAKLTDSTHTGAGSVALAFSAADGLFHFLSQGETLTMTYNVTVTDSHGASSTQPVTFTVTGTNDTPVVAADTSVHAFSDLVGGDGSTTPDTSSAVLAFTDANLDDTHTVSVGTPTVKWSGGTAIPTAALAALSSAVTATLTDSTYTGAGSVALSFSAADGVFHFLSTGETLTVTYDVSVTDSHGGTSTQPVTFTITGVDDAPVVAVDTGVHAFADIAGGSGSITPDTVATKLSFTDPNLDDTHTVTIAAPTATWSAGTIIPAAALTALKSALAATLSDSTHTGMGSVALAFSAADGVFHFLSAGETLTVTYDVTVTDSSGLSSAQPVTIIVTGTNDAPVLAVDTSVHAFSDVAGGAGSTTPDTSSATLIFTDVNLDDTHTVSIGTPTVKWSGGTAVPTAALAALNAAVTATLSDSTHTGAGSVALSFSAADGVFHFLSQGETLTATYNVTVIDSHGATSTQPVTFTVTGVDDAPTITAAAVESVAENSILNVTAATLAATAADVNLNNTLTVTSVGNAQNGTVSLINGVVTFTPTANYFGAASYNYTVSDSHGQSVTATANVMVTAPASVTTNFVPVAPTIPVPATGMVNENAPLNVTAAALVATAVDVNPNEGLTLASVGNAQNGTVSITNGVVTFTPTTGFYGAASYQYTVIDAYGLSTTATAIVTVNHVSTPPTLSLVNTTGPENTAIAVSIGTAVTDPTDQITDLVVSALPVGSTLSDGAGGHTFTATAGATQVDVSGWTLAQLTLIPPTNFVGTVPLTVTSTSDLATTAPASTTGTLTVTSTLDHAAPVALNDTVTVNEGVAKTINVLFNDIEQAGLPLSVSSVTSASHGALVINSNNTITYTPNAGYTGTDSFTYTNSDGHGGVSVGTVNLTIRPPSPAVAPLIAVGSNTQIIPTDGSAVKTVLTLHAGDVVSFNWSFATTDYSPFKDFAFATVNGTAFMLADTQSVGNDGASGVHTFTYKATADGTYTFGAGVINDQDQNYNSYLAVDNLAVNGTTVQGFSNGLTGLNGVTTTALGNVTEVSQGVTSTGATLTPGNGTSEAFLTSAPILETNIESFLGLAQGQLAKIPLSLGNEYTPIVLPISVTVAPNNPDDTYLTVSGAPVGTVFNHGLYDSSTNTWKIEAADLGGDLTLTTPSNYSGSFTLSVTATSVSYGTNTTATTAAQTQLVSVAPAAVTLDGSAGNQVLVGGAVAGNTLIGGPGDALTGGSTSDAFVFNGTAFGNNTITDFNANTDVIQFSHTVFADAATALSHAAQVGSDVLITFDANDTVTLKNVLLANLHASDFHII